MLTARRRVLIVCSHSISGICRAGGAMSVERLFSRDNLPYVLGTGVAASAVMYLIFKRKKRTPRIYQPDTVYVHGLGRGPYAPSMSPFPVKLETYLRMSNIPYKSVTSWQPSEKKKWPWMQYNNEKIADSQFCIQWCNKKFSIDLDSHLTLEEKGIARAFDQMLGEDVYWAMFMFRWFWDEKQIELIKIAWPKLRIWQLYFLKRMMYKNVWAQGMARHNREEVTHIILEDMKAISNYLGDKPYLMGDRPSQVDCTLFAFASQLIYHGNGSELIESTIKDFPNLKPYVERIKAEFWPDWDDCITHGGTRKPTK